MLKFVLLAIVLTVANGQLMGGWKPIDTNGLPDTVEKIARWSLAAMNQKLITSGSEGFHAQMIGIKDVFSQVVAGTNYKFSMDTIYSESSKYTVRCNILVNTYFIYCYI